MPKISELPKTGYCAKTLPEDMCVAIEQNQEFRKITVEDILKNIAEKSPEVYMKYVTIEMIKEYT